MATVLAHSCASCKSSWRKTVLELACRRALSLGAACSYKSLESICAKAWGKSLPLELNRTCPCLPDDHANLARPRLTTLDPKENPTMLPFIQP